MEWIPLSERLPQAFERVLVSTGDNIFHVDIAIFTRTKQFIVYDGAREIEINPDAWMPLPKSYRKGKHEAAYVSA